MSDLSALEQQLKGLKLRQHERNLVLRLQENTEFRKLILEDFCRDEVARLVALSTDPNLQREQRDDALEMGKAAGHLLRYLNTTIQMGNRADKEIIDVEAAIEEARIEDEQPHVLDDDQDEE